MEFPARFQDGQIAGLRDVLCRREGGAETGMLVILENDGRRTLARWPVEQLVVTHGRRGELRFGAQGQLPGARLIVNDPAAVSRAHEILPTLGRRSKADRETQVKWIAGATGALLSVILAYVFGVPLIAGRIVDVLPPVYESRLGDQVAVQIEELIGGKEGLPLCDADPDSTANRAIRRFADLVLEDTSSLFDVDIAVVHSEIPNAFALPGGRVYYFSGLLEQTESADEFAGVLAHEIGHVVHRHGMEQVVSTAGTGLLIGFVLGDMTGLSVAGAVGSALIDTRFSRDAEREADVFSANAAERAGFEPSALGVLLGRIAGDDDLANVTSLLNSHPLSSERAHRLAELTPAAKGAPAFSAREWEAVRSMCDTSAPEGATRGKLDNVGAQW